MVPGSIKGTCPYDFPIKGNADSVIYHTPDSPYYFKTRAEICFDSTEAAEATWISSGEPVLGCAPKKEIKFSLTLRAPSVTLIE